MYDVGTYYGQYLFASRKIPVSLLATRFAALHAEYLRFDSRKDSKRLCGSILNTGPILPREDTE